MRAIDQIEEIYKSLRGINYENKEGGRYAYVQMMAYTRDLKNVLMTFYSTVKFEVKEIEKIHDDLNEHVSLTFSLKHRDIFMTHMKKLEELSEILQHKLRESDKKVTVQPCVKLVA